MKNWEIMAVLESRPGDSESWACPALRPRNKRTRVGWPFKSDSPSTAGNPAPAQASPSLSLLTPAPLPRHSAQVRPLIGRGRGPWRVGGAEGIFSDWLALSGAGHVGSDVSRQFRLVGRSPPRGRF